MRTAARCLPVRPQAQGPQRAGRGVGACGHEGDEDVARAAAERSHREDLIARGTHDRRRPERSAGGRADDTRARPVPSDCVHTATAWPSGVKASCGERAKPPGAESRTARRRRRARARGSPRRSRPRWATPRRGVPSGSAATADSNAAPAGRRVLAPAVRLAMAIV